MFRLKRYRRWEHTGVKHWLQHYPRKKEIKRYIRSISKKDHATFDFSEEINQSTAFHNPAMKREINILDRYSEVWFCNAICYDVKRVQVEGKPQGMYHLHNIGANIFPGDHIKLWDNKTFIVLFSENGSYPSGQIWLYIYPLN